MKKTFALLLCLVLSFSLLFTGCGGDQAQPTTTAATTTAAASTTQAASTSTPPTTTKAPATTATTRPAEPVSTTQPATQPNLLEGREVLDFKFFSIAYPEEWVLNESTVRDVEDESRATFSFDADGRSSKASITIRAAEEPFLRYTRDFTTQGIALEDLVEGKLPTMDFDGTAFVNRARPTATPSFLYRHVPSGVTYRITFSSLRSEDTMDGSLLTDFFAGIKLHLEDAGKPVILWPWRGNPVRFLNTTTQDVGTHTLTAEFLQADEPLVTIADYMSSATAGDTIYTVNKNTLHAYRVASGGLALEGSTKLDNDYSMVRTDSSGSVYLSRSTGKMSLYAGLTKVTETDALNEITMHKSGSWGISKPITEDPKKVVLNNGVFEMEPWVLENLRDDGTRVGPFKSLSTFFISDSHITAAGSLAEGRPSGAYVYNLDGKEQFALADPDDSVNGVGILSGVVETKNGFVTSSHHFATANENLHFWNTKGDFLGIVTIKDLISAKSPAITDLSVMDDGSILVAFTQMRDDESALELLFMRLTGF